MEIFRLALHTCNRHYRSAHTRDTELVLWPTVRAHSRPELQHNAGPKSPVQKAPDLNCKQLRLDHLSRPLATRNQRQPAARVPVVGQGYGNELIKEQRRSRSEAGSVDFGRGTRVAPRCASANAGGGVAPGHHHGQLNRVSGGMGRWGGRVAKIDSQRNCK